MPTNEEIQRAIEQLTNLSEHVDDWGVKMGQYPTYSHGLKLGISALQARQLVGAIQWNGNNLREVIDLVGLNPSANKWTWAEYEQVVREQGLKIFSAEGKIMANIGDWIIKAGDNCYVAALRQMRPEPCEWCENLAAGTWELMDDEGIIHLAHFCPACGRDLKSGE